MSDHWPDKDRRSVQGLEKFVTWLALFVLLFLYWGYVWLFERIDYLAIPPAWWQSLVGRYPLLDLIAPLVLIPFEFLSFRVLRHFIPVLLAAGLARMAVHRFLASFFTLPDTDSAKTLLQRLRAWQVPNRPSVKLDADNFARERRHNPILTVGGPARVNVGRGSAIVTELNGRFARVLGPGSQFLARFEYPFAVIDLRPQNRSTDATKLMTTDGIEITASVGVTFHIAYIKKRPTEDVPFPFDRQAARKAAYAQTNKGGGQVSDWRAASLGVAIGQLEEIVGESRLDELAHPMHGGIKPIPSRNRMMRQQTQVKMQPHGVTVTDTQLGRFELPEPVLHKYLEFWRVYWEKRRRLEEAEGQAAVIEETEIARARASALMLQAIVEGLQRAKTMDQEASSRRILAIRLIETLQTMARRSQNLSSVPDHLLVSLGRLRQQLLEDSQAGKSSRGPTET